MREFVEFVAGAVGGKAEGDCNSRGAGGGAKAFVGPDLDGERTALLQRSGTGCGAGIFGSARAGAAERDEDSAARRCGPG